MHNACNVFLFLTYPEQGIEKLRLELLSRPEHLWDTYRLLSDVKGGFCFHPIEQESLAGDPVEEKAT
jgi:hypothetical protein